MALLARREGSRNLSHIWAVASQAITSEVSEHMDEPKGSP